MNNMFEYRGFYGSVEYSLEDKCFHGIIVGIRDLVTFEGDTIQELEKAFHEMTDDYIIDCEILGKKPVQYKGSFNIVIPPELHKRAALIADRKGISLNDFVEKAITSELYLN